MRRATPAQFGAILGAILSPGDAPSDAPCSAPSRAGEPDRDFFPGSGAIKEGSDAANVVLDVPITPLWTRARRDAPNRGREGFRHAVQTALCPRITAFKPDLLALLGGV